MLDKDMKSFYKIRSRRKRVVEAGKEIQNH
jgi:hypothetical protein